MNREFPVESDSWKEYRRLVVQGLKDLDNDIQKLDNKTDNNIQRVATDLRTSIENLGKRLEEINLQFTKDITALQIKAGWWGSLAGALGGAAVTLILNYLIHVK